VVALTTTTSITQDKQTHNLQYSKYQHLAVVDNHWLIGCLAAWDWVMSVLSVMLLMR